MSRRSILFAAAALATLARAAAAAADQPAAPERHVRGDVVAVAGRTVTVKTGDARTVKVELADDTRVSVASRADLGSIGPNAFVGTTSVAQPDGSLRALEVHVFPESMRGTGEGQRPWDLGSGSTMTNATVEGVDSKGGAAPPSTMTNADVASASRDAGERGERRRGEGDGASRHGLLRSGRRHTPANHSYPWSSQ